MSNLSLFMKQNKVAKTNTKYAVTKSLSDKDGKPLEWEIKSLTTKDDEAIKESCTFEVPVKGKPNLFRQKMNTTDYLAKMLAASVVVPDLYDAALQDSYGVKTPEDLLKEIVDDPGEYNDFGLFVQKFNGFNISMDEKVDEAKN